MKRPDIVPKTIEEKRYPIRRPNIDMPVVVARVAARGSIAQPLIEAIAAVGAVLKDTPGRKWIPASFGQRFRGHRAKTHIQVAVLRPHHDRPSALARLALSTETLVKIAVPVCGDHRPDKCPLVQTRLAGYRPRLFLHSLQRWHQYGHQ